MNSKKKKLAKIEIDDTVPDEMFWWRYIGEIKGEEGVEPIEDLKSGADYSLWQFKVNSDYYNTLITQIGYPNENPSVFRAKDD